MNPTYEEQVRNINSVKSTSQEDKARAISYLKNPMPLESLQDTNETVLPNQKTDTTTFPELTPLQAEEKRIQDTSTQSDEEYRKTLEDIGVVEGREREYAEELGATENRLLYKDYENKLMLEKRAMNREIARLQEEPQAVSQSFLNSMIADVERKSLQKQADLAILGNMALGNYNEALSIAKEKVESELKPLTRQLEYLKDVRETNKDLLTTAQKAKLNTLYADVEREKNKEEERLTKGNEMIINAIQSGASSRIIDSAKSILNSGGSITDIIKSLGGYSMSLSDRLDNQLKQAQLNKLNAPSDGEAPIIKSIDGKDMQWDGSKWVKPKTEFGGSVDPVSQFNEEQKIKTLDSLMANNGGIGLATSAGPLRGAPIPFLFKDTINDWRADIISISSKLTMDNLVNLKGEGATFGALSDSERIAIGQAASSIVSSAILDKNGNPTGKFKMSEKKVLEELKTIQDGYKLNFERKYGMSYDEYLKNKNPETFWKAIDGSSLQTNYGDYPTN